MPEQDGLFNIHDLDDAVAAGAIDRSAAEKLVEHLARHKTKAASQADEEQFRLVTGFNDIFVTIGIALFIGALAYLAPQFAGLAAPMAGGTSAVGLGLVLTPLSCAIAAWGLAEIFTRRRRMALPSIVLLAVFVVSAGWLARIVPANFMDGATATGNPEAFPYLAGSIAATLAAAAHWARFQVPITVAAAAAAVCGLALSFAELLFPGILIRAPQLTFLPAGFVVFAIAMVFDTSDRLRVTRRTDIAFWLHLLAAPLIVHPVVSPLATGAATSAMSAVQVFAIFAVLSIIALIVDRRALLVSSLAYLGGASFQMVKLMGLGDSTSGLPVLAVGAVVLVLSVGWQNLRRIFLKLVPNSLRDLLPPLADRSVKVVG